MEENWNPEDHSYEESVRRINYIAEIIRRGEGSQYSSRKRIQASKKSCDPAGKRQ